MADAQRRARTRALVALNLAALLWSIGLGAAVPVIPLLSYRFVPSAFAAALVTSIGGLGRLLISYFAGDLMDRFGKRRISLIGIFIRMTFSFLEGFSRSYFQLLAFRFGSGVGTAIWGTGLTAMTADIAKRGDRGRLTGLRSTLSDVGHVLGPFLGGWAWGATGSIRVPFFINGFSKMGVFLTIFFLMREPEPIEEEDEDSQTSGTASRGGNGRSELMAAVVSLGFLFIIYALFAQSLFREGITNVIMPLYAKLELGLSQTNTGLIISAIGLGGVVSSLPAGFVADRWGVRAAVIPGALLVTGALLLLATNKDAGALVLGVPLTLAVVAFVAGVGGGVINVSSQAYAIDLSPRGARGRFFGLNMATRHFATLVGPLMIGGLADQSYSYAFLLLAGIFIIIVPASIVAVREKPRQRQTTGQAKPRE
jgi:MFS family permease